MIPPVVVIIALAAVVTRLSDSATAAGIFRGVRAAVAALILLSVIKMSKNILKGIFPTAAAVIAFILLVFFFFFAVILILCAALAGLCFEGIRRVLKKRGENVQ